MKHALLLALLLTACSDTGCSIEETVTRVSKGSEVYWERCWREKCPNTPHQVLRCRRE